MPSIQFFVKINILLEVCNFYELFILFLLKFFQ